MAGRDGRGLAGARVMDAPTFRDERGALGVVEAKGLPFAVERIYWLYDVPADSSRGDHGHRTLQQFLIPMCGSLTVMLHDGFESRTWRLSGSQQGLYVPPMMWRRLEQFSAGAVCLILASQSYNRDDYFRDFDQFVSAAQAERA